MTNYQEVQEELRQLYHEYWALDDKNSALLDLIKEVSRAPNIGTDKMSNALEELQRKQGEIEQELQLVILKINQLEIYTEEDSIFDEAYEAWKRDR